MIVFHEGLPGAGKSYEACVYHILPSLEKGRRVVTNIEGINHEKFSELTGIPLPYIKQNLVTIYEVDVEKQRDLILEHAGTDSLLVIDEIQNYFPAERQKLSPEWTKFITEHRHKGLDIILMGQHRNDCHNLWRRRVQRIIVFTKLTAVDMVDSYRWSVEELNGSKFRQISSGVKKYETKYFGLYSSFVDGAEHKEVYKDKRAVQFTKQSMFVWAGAFVAVLALAIYTLVGFFSPQGSDEAIPAEIEQSSEEPITTTAESVPTNPPKPQAVSLGAAPPVVELPKPIDAFDSDIATYKPRLVGPVVSVENEAKIFFEVEMLNGSNHLKATWLPAEIVAIGWRFNVHKYGIVFKKGDKTHTVRSWPLENTGQVNARYREKL